MAFGTPLKLQKVQLDPAKDQPIPGCYYEIQVVTDRGVPENQKETLINQIVTGFQQRGLTVQSVEVNDNQTTIQFRGSPFEWIEILSFLPLIFTLLGLAVLLLAIFSLITSVPTWVWGALVIGSVLIFLEPWMSGAIRHAAPAKKTIPPPPPPQRQRRIVGYEPSGEPIWGT